MKSLPCLILLAGSLLTSCSQRSELIHSQRITLPQTVLQVDVHDRGTRLSTRHAMITVKNLDTAPLSVVYTVAINGQHGGDIDLVIRFREAVMEPDPAAGVLASGVAGSEDRQVSHDFIVTLALTTVQIHRFYLDTSYNSDQPLSVTIRPATDGLSGHTGLTGNEQIVLRPE